ncbi:MAG: DUF1217 domain-containing protein [Albidovulum sp.]|uniref:DUF1217 domain-containing protein n=1 Tax=Albidovulum sp. TaxID=1872424 RepID=UPI003CBC1142
MTYSPVVPFGGYAGWKFLARTRDAQKEAFVASNQIQRDDAYFREKIGTIQTAEDLVADRRLLSVALGAFGLSDDINNKYFIRKVLEDGTLDTDALGNKLSDKRYLELSKAFGFGDFAIPRTQLSDFADKILASYKTRQFEEAVGNSNDQMRLAMNAERELAVLAGRDLSADAKWFTVLGSPPLREVFQTALGLPPAFAAVDIDRQLVTFKDKAESFLGINDISDFSDPEKVEDLVRLFLLRSETQVGAGYSSSSAALTLLQTAANRGGLLSRLI